MIYLDASALVTYVLERPNVVELHRYLDERPGIPLATSTVGLIETVRNCDRSGSFPNLMAQLLRDYDELLVTGDVRDNAADLTDRLRTLDAIHVATAEMLGPHLVAFVTYDRRLARVAGSRGLPVASPGAPPDVES